MFDELRKSMVQSINSEVQSLDKDQERTRLEEEYGTVWDTDELREDFKVLGFAAPFVIVEDREGRRGTLMFQHHPRFYFSWSEDK